MTFILIILDFKNIYGKSDMIKFFDKKKKMNLNSLNIASFS